MSRVQEAIEAGLEAAKADRERERLDRIKQDEEDRKYHNERVSFLTKEIQRKEKYYLGLITAAVRKGDNSFIEECSSEFAEAFRMVFPELEASYKSSEFPDAYGTLIVSWSKP